MGKKGRNDGEDDDDSGGIGRSLETELPDPDPVERPVGTEGRAKVSSSSEMDGNLASVLDMLKLREGGGNGGAGGNAGENIRTGEDDGVDAGDGGPNEDGDTKACGEEDVEAGVDGTRGDINVEGEVTFGVVKTLGDVGGVGYFAPCCENRFALGASPSGNPLFLRACILSWIPPMDVVFGPSSIFSRALSFSSMALIRLAMSTL